MRRVLAIVMAGLILAVSAYFGAYYAATSGAHRVETSKNPELTWLKQEFQLSDADFARICQLHDSYLAGCAERCRLVDEKNERLKLLLAATNMVTPEIEQTLVEAAQLRTECHKKMLQHFYDVSKTMPPAQGSRYLAWIQAQTILPDTHSQMVPQSAPTHHH